jgi:hypothetical protein
MRWRVFLILACAGFLAIPQARADETLQQKYLNIYLKINEAEQMQNRGDYRGALEDFKECYEGLAKINKSDPNWETALVLHRMADCKAKIMELQPKADAQPMTTQVRNPGLNADMGNTGTETLESAQLKEQLDAVTAELNVTKQKLQEANTQSDAYRTQLEAVNQQMAAFKGQQTADARMAKLTAQNKDLTDKLAEAQKDLDGYRNNPKSKLAQAEAQVKNLQDQLAASQEANKALQDTTTTLKQQLDQASADLVAANQKLAAAGPGSAEYTRLKRENEIMRGILTRELQEQGRRDMAKKLIEEEFDNLKLKSTVLQEHLDEATSVMTPPTTDEERALIASLRPSSPDVVPPPPGSNTFSAPAGPGSVATTGDTNAVPSTPTPPSVTADATQTNAVANVTPPAPDTSSTNPAPVQIVMNGGESTPTNTAPTPAPDTSRIRARPRRPGPPHPTRTRRFRRPRWATRRRPRHRRPRSPILQRLPSPTRRSAMSRRRKPWCRTPR